MQGDSGETQFTFDGNAAAPAEGISQSSPGTADSGDKSTRTTKSGWQKMTSRHRRASTTSTPRSARDVARSGNARRSHRSPRRTPTEHRTPRAVEDKPGRESSDISAKRRSTEARGSSEPIAIIEELREQCQTLREKVTQSEMYAASRDQVIRDIEAKFTEYLRGHNQQVFNEINILNRRLMYSTNEVTEYHAELMLASKEDEGATIRIEELERRGALAEHGARRIHRRGLEIQEEYKDEVHHLQGLLGNTESRLQQMQHDSSLARSVAESLHKEGNEMQRNLESSIVEYRSQSELANFSHTHLEMTSQRQAFAVNELNDENQMLSEALIHSRKQAELYENNMEQITREYRKKINEANNAKLESDLRHRNTEHDTVKRFANYRNTEAEAIAHLRFESSISSNAREKMEHYEMLYDNERALTNELKTEIEDRNVKLRRSLQEGPMAIGHGPNLSAIQHLEAEVKVAQVRAQDLSEEMDECMYMNIRLKDELAEASRQGSSTPFGSEVAILRTELESERKYKLATGAQQYERSCEYLGELRDRDEKLMVKDAEISKLRKGLIDAEIAIKSQESLNALPFSAGITSSGLSPYMIIGKLESDIEAANDESNVLRAWIRQLDDELNKESATAHSNILLQVQGKYISYHHIPRIKEYLNSYVRSTRRFWTGKELALMKGQASPIIGGLTVTMILIFQVGLLILTDLLGLLIHLVCLRFEDHRGIQQLIWSPQLLSPLRNLQGYPDEKRTRCTSAHGQSTRIWVSGNLISLKVYASLPTTAIEPHGKPGYNQHSDRTLTSML